ncbi:isoleucine--tRNA ligase, cytoplasmic [Trichonephila inaurata madagascariensis]|uniref:isoleucine--tRNA ligase n=1 Tax=Trichonephila inaurata madagascariensis TaxID=2747483 RepID=A0A8X6IBL6_9ARAC|nr:isoleucine--tRNA ligase, cytoplasmic [Trichonephila inaurata madagascariensis]
MGSRNRGQKFSEFHLAMCLADGQQSTSLVRKATIPITIGGRTFQIDLIFLPHAKGNRTLLGVDFLKTSGIVMDMRNNFWYFGDKPSFRIPFSKDVPLPVDDSPVEINSSFCPTNSIPSEVPLHRNTVDETETNDLHLQEGQSLNVEERNILMDLLNESKDAFVAFSFFSVNLLLSSKKMVEEVPEYIEFPKEEENILNFWKTIDAFKNCLKQSKGKPRYTFYDGPPFATGLPHYGHILAGTIKDIVTRFAHQTGYHVERRFGWDCHGLPVEYEIDKTLNIKGPSDVEKLGIENYNNECRKIVMRYAKQWQDIVGRMGRWIDFENDYKTLYPSFMESVWYIFKQLYNKGYVYQGVKVMPFSTACSTPLSNFESGQNYQNVVDPAVIVSFPLDKTPNVSLIIWTTTPWTLPSNLAICVNPDLDYVKVKDNATEKIYIMMEARLEALFQKEAEYTVLEKFKGKTLEGSGYEPLFPYFKHLKSSGAFRVLCDSYVTSESGTGVVHQAPYFGEDDFRICLANGVIRKDQDIVCPIDLSGKFVDPVVDFKGQYVKDADKNIMKHLKSLGRLVHQSTVKHSYPFCWRSETPLIYRAIPSWFIRVEQMQDLLQAANQETYDWAVSRNRYWGTPIPLWISDDGEEVVCVGSIEELERLTNQKITDLHRESIDHLTIPSACGKGQLHRVSEVFDCWFESGSMPYAQVHYPFENTKEFSEGFPADFIAEGLDQTRGWFYTLLVISTALYGKAPFKNVIVNGLVLASDRQKMSKRKKNYPDPLDVVNKYGADSLRLYLINSPVVRAEVLCFKEEGVRDILKDVFLPWYNSYRFLVQNIHMYENNWNTKFSYSEEIYDSVNIQNIMDCWILSFTQSLVSFVSKEMKAYRLYTVVPKLVKFVDHLTNWYVRMNRRRLKGDGGQEDCKTALETLFSVLYTMIRMMAPFTPFFTELVYQNLRKVLKETNDHQESIHYLSFPQHKEHLINVEVERKVSRMQEVIDIGRLIRERNTLPIKYPLSELVVVHEDLQYLEDVKSLEKYIVEVLVLLDVTRDQDMVDEGSAREIINRIQKLRKKAHLVPSDAICVYVDVKPPNHHLNKVMQNFKEFISNTLKAPLHALPAQTPPNVIIQETSQIKDASLDIVICNPSGKPLLNLQKESVSENRKKLKVHHENGEPFCRFVNVELCDVGTCSVLLENPKGKFILSSDALSRQVQVVFGIHGKLPQLYLNSDKTKPLNKMSEEEVLNLHKRTLYAYLS